MNKSITVNCMNGFTLGISENNVIVSTRRTEEAFPIANIQSIALKEPRGLSYGSITFKNAQPASANMSIGFGLGLALGAEQNFFFQKAELENALAFRDYVLNAGKKDVPSAPAGKVVSIVEEIRGLKELMDEGILTLDEFEQKKKKLLDM